MPCVRRIRLWTSVEMEMDKELLLLLTKFIFGKFQVMKLSKNITSRNVFKKKKKDSKIITERKNQKSNIE